MKQGDGDSAIDIALAKCTDDVIHEILKRNPVIDRHKVLSVFFEIIFLQSQQILKIAVTKGKKPEILSLLIAHGADPNFRNVLFCFSL